MVLEKKRKTKVYSSSVGHKILFNQIPRKLKKLTTPKQWSQEKILCRLQQNKNCCSGGRHYLGCIGLKFVDEASPDQSIDTSKLLDYMKECREMTRYKNGRELRQFVKEVYEKADVSQSNHKTTMNYRLPIFATTTVINKSNNKVCRQGTRDY